MNSVIRLLVTAALLLFVVAPFAGLAPLLLVLLLSGIAWVANDFLRVLLGKAPAKESDESEAHPS
ncbi:MULTISPECIES: hypothetical protein [unclassified Leptolyngbya]|uniref:hypothetical protein n=1 Tax=unclassified Leptolyngbya TaxID=2650499 RepID=UPI0016878EEF|nr:MULTISPECIES: hypothetical protein [unclassified Leptolyngbya]MBD1909050.1 hypothetical protein [Leptolyngbya sp. FACHB-8]MBD2157431.1 hypothetical protein [Leptolyngbya sp. FACHB-16]